MAAQGIFETRVDPGEWVQTTVFGAQTEVKRDTHIIRLPSDPTQGQVVVVLIAGCRLVHVRTLIVVHDDPQTVVQRRQNEMELQLRGELPAVVLNVVCIEAQPYAILPLVEGREIAADKKPVDTANRLLDDVVHGIPDVVGHVPVAATA